MFDILPSNSGGAHASRPKRARPIRSVRPLRPSTASKKARGGFFAPGSEPVVQVDWKLPARLRKPIREQLQKERKKKRQREAILRFQRRPLNTKHLLAEQQPQRANQGAEHHTGDVYASTRPQVRVALPPYAGSVSRFLQKGSKPAPRTKLLASRALKRSTVQPQQRPVTRSAQPAPRQAVRQVPLQRTRPVAKSQPVRKPVPIFAERDIAYDWTQKPTVSKYEEPVHDEERDIEYLPESAEQQLSPAESETVTIQQPRRRFALPLTFSIWPKNTSPAKKKFQFKVKPRLPRVSVQGKGIPIGMLLAGCVVIMGVVWNLQGIGRGTLVLGSVEMRARQAYEKVVVAQSALAEGNFTDGELALSDAEELFQKSREELATALDASGHVLRYLDVTGTVRSGEELLFAGEKLTVAGQHISRGAAGFYNVSVLPAPDMDGSAPGLTEAIMSAQKEFQLASVELNEVERSLKHIDSPFLPSELAGHVETLRTSVPKVNEYLKQFSAKSDMMLRLLGADRQRQYLFLFANNHEIRPTGGFIGSVGLVNVDSGRVENIDVTSVYDPDGQLKEYIAPPYPLLSVTNRWYMRDANWFVDYRLNASKIAAFFEKEGGPTVDGVITITPEVIRTLLQVTGPIEVPGYNVTVSAENIHEVIQQQVTYEYDKEANKPKQFMADLTPLLLNTLAGNGAAGGELLGALSRAVESKDLLMYFRDDEVQAHLESVGWAGNFPQDMPGFLNINNANIGGHKSDQFVEQEVDYRVEISADGVVEAVVTIRRTHHGPQEAGSYVYPEGENPSIKNNVIYQRVLVPEGAELLEVKGFTPQDEIPRTVLDETGLNLKPDVDVVEWQRTQAKHSSGTMIGNEAGYTFFANWIITRPGETSIAFYRYRLPVKLAGSSLFTHADNFSMYIAKQPGDSRTAVRASLKLPANSQIAHIVPQEGVTRASQHEIIYRGALKRDIVVGAAFEY